VDADAVEVMGGMGLREAQKSEALVEVGGVIFGCVPHETGDVSCEGESGEGVGGLCVGGGILEGVLGVGWGGGEQLGPSPRSGLPSVAEIPSPRSGLPVALQRCR
jgi:hypothetical protein